MLFLSPHSANKTPHALRSAWSYRRQGARRRCSLCARSCSITQMFGSRREHHKMPLSSTLRAGRYSSEETRGANSSITLAISPSGANFVVQPLPLGVKSEGIRRVMLAGWLKRDAFRWFSIHASFNVLAFQMWEVLRGQYCKRHR